MVHTGPQDPTVEAICLSVLGFNGVRGNVFSSSLDRFQGQVLASSTTTVTSQTTNSTSSMPFGHVLAVTKTIVLPLKSHSTENLSR